ncbi:unnamed protein product [Rotaria sp. Silwood1]|nr:unnamed protein product [Rotaria sp. Silwood1]CAF1391093.1 unnamed protein product [Rotaria sp. Silwood1]CAF3708602.1 unnamed protein product [Rotaria sp. Silwood1]CAF4694300.1 unnamed protein product [Rotaria sp. Silwood1]
MKQYIIIIIIGITALFSSVYCASSDNCTNLSNQDCQTCLSLQKCAYCKNTKLCFRYDPETALEQRCTTADLQWQTCVGNFRVWIIIVSVIAGIVLLAIIIAICCVCRKCKRISIRREERRQQRDDQRIGERMEERRAAAEVRTNERNRVADQIRMKYGILKAKENATDYARME